MYAADDAAQLTYVQCGILAAILLNSGAADYVITGCGTGEGRHAGTEQLPRRHLRPRWRIPWMPTPLPTSTMATPCPCRLPKGFGWGGELNLEYTFEKLFGFGFGKGYPKGARCARAAQQEDPGRRARATFKPLIECLKSIDQGSAEGRCGGLQKFSELFFASCKGRGAGRLRRPCCKLRRRSCKD